MTSSALTFSTPTSCPTRGAGRRARGPARLAWQGGGVQAQEPVGGQDGHVAAQLRQLPVQLWQLGRHELLRTTEPVHGQHDLTSRPASLTRMCNSGSFAATSACAHRGTRWWPASTCVTAQRRQPPVQPCSFAATSSCSHASTTPRTHATHLIQSRPRDRGEA